jgi:hypothetical protein
MSVDLINLWHQRARPSPTAENLDVQLGCHAEEFVEMLEALNGSPRIRAAIDAVRDLADAWKGGTECAFINDRKELLDSLADQIVTATGVGHCANMNVPEACRRVNISNWSKYNKDGQPLFKASGKIDKGPDYKEPDLRGLY